MKFNRIHQLIVEQIEWVHFPSGTKVLLVDNSANIVGTEILKHDTNDSKMPPPIKVSPDYVFLGQTQIKKNGKLIWVSRLAPKEKSIGGKAYMSPENREAYDEVIGGLKYTFNT